MTTENIKAAGGGCFPAGTKINTPTGYRFIEDIKVGDLVYGFTLSALETGMPDVQPGRVFPKQVTEVHKHSFGEVGYTSPLLEITYHAIMESGKVHDGVLLVTGNHYILTPSRQSEGTDEGFARADALEVGDTIWTEYGDAVQITAITPAGEYDFVYNFEVADFATYIAGGIRAHNGGGGKDKHTPVQAPNSVRTKQVVRALFCPSEGESGGLFYTDDIARSVFFDGTVLKNADGTYNFTNISVEQRTGLPDQSVITGFSAVESEILLGLPLTAATSVTRTVSSGAIDSVRITIEFPGGLQKINKDNGDANGTSVSFTIQRRVVNGTWETVISPTIREMSSGPFTSTFLIPRPLSTGPWEFKVIRTTADSSANEISDDTTVDSYTEIQDVKLPYNDRGLVALTVGADSTNGKIPAVSLDWVGVKVKVPSNYNRVTREYVGAWNGTFALERFASDNPAWVIYDLLTNPRYGQGDRFTEAQLDKWSFYEAAKYCEELIDDGKKLNGVSLGTMEPRFTFNSQLMVRENAWKTLNTIAATMNAKLYIQAGFVRIAQDRPATPTRIISNSNVIGGLFSYSSTSVDDTYTMCNVTYNDPLDNFLPKTISEVAASNYITRYGLNSTDLAAYGATSQGQARRAAKWVIDTSVRQSSMVSFAVSLEHAAFEPNEIFYLMDEDYSQTTQEGRVVSIVGNVITLDKPVVKSGVGTWTITVYGADGNTIETRTITNANGTLTSVTVNSPVTAVKGAVYIITGSVSPRQFRMTGMSDNGDLTYLVQAVQHDPNKYARIEQNTFLPDDVYWQSPELNTVNIPTNLLVQPQSAMNDDGQIYRFLNLSWTPPADGTAQSYSVQWRRNFQPFVRLEVEEPFLRIPSDFSGNYEFYINAVNSASVTSPTLKGTYNFDVSGDVQPSEIGPITNLQILGGGTTFKGAMQVEWSAPPTSALVTLKDYEVTIKTAGGTVLRTFFTRLQGFTYSLDDNIADGGPRAALLVVVRARDTNNNFSTPVGQNFSSTAAAGISGLTVRGGGTVFNTMNLDVVWSAVTNGLDWRSDPNFAYFKVEVLNGATVKRSTSVTDATYIYSFSDNVKDNGQDTPSASITIRVTAYSKLDVAGVSASATFTPAAPPAVTSLVVKGTASNIFNEADLNITWVCNDTAGQRFGASNMFKLFKVEAMNGAAVKRTTTAFNEAYSYSMDENAQDNAGAPIRNPTIRITATNLYNISSSAVSNTFSNPAPAVPSNIQVLPGIGNYKVVFDKPAETDYLGTFIWASTTTGFTPSSANLVADISGAYAAINSTPGTSYFVKIAAYDVFGKNAKDGSGLNISTQSTVAAEAAGITKSATAPTTGMVKGDVYINTTEDPPKLYRYTGTAWTAAVPAVDVSGQLTDAQISGVAAAKLTTQITSTQITNGAITTAKLAAGSVTSNEIAANTIVAADIAAGTITATQLAADTITANEIAAGAITASELATNSVTAIKILASTISTDKIAANAVTTALLAANSVVSDKIAAGAITADKIQAGAITANEIASGAITAVKIAAGTITADKIAAGTITGDKIVGNTITADKIDGRNLIIRDGANNILFGAGNLLQSGQINPSAGWLNSNVTAGSIGAVGASNPITAGNASTYIANAAIDTLRLRNGAVTNIQTGSGNMYCPPINLAARQTTYNSSGVTSWVRIPTQPRSDGGGKYDVLISAMLEIPHWAWSPFQHLQTVNVQLQVSWDASNIAATYPLAYVEQPHSGIIPHLSTDETTNFYEYGWRKLTTIHKVLNLDVGIYARVVVYHTMRDNAWTYDNGAASGRAFDGAMYFSATTPLV